VSYNTRARDIDNTDSGFGPDPVLVVIARGVTDVARLVRLLNTGVSEHQQLAREAAGLLRNRRGGRAALAELARDGGPDLTVPVDEEQDGHTTQDVRE
jgi:hypothetical protein